ncbi:MAG: 16S rRNA (cytosine(967)-C(5))-methyltransferase RsmB [Clostridia bacterium]|nr:16S rRNA (cytosine(967)-C(5))-methyltransferase RsmB [Clostridia bacterium]
MFNPREAALNSLVKWDSSASFSNIELNTVISRQKAEKNDNSLYTLLFLGVIEKKMLLDSIIDEYSQIPPSKIEIQTKNILRLGIYQLLFTDKIPEYSAVSESVNLANKRSKGFVNAVLRSFIRAGKKYSLPNEKWERISLENSIPMDIINIFRSSYGDDIATELCTLPPQKSHISLRINTLRTSVDEVIAILLKKDYIAEKSSLARDIVITNAPISALEDILDNGYAFVQDESSRIASEVFGAQAGEVVADVCACPGGKSFSIALDMQNKGELYSSDLHQNKLSLIEKGAKRLGVDIINTRAQNAKELVPEYLEKFDRVLCDVPCSGLGVIFKKPDIKYKPIDNINALPSVQYDILINCAKYVKKGGILVYSTCTINSLENEKNIEKFLLENPSFEAVDFEIGEIKSNKGGYTFLPCKIATDGFFVAKMRRKDD